MTQLESSIAELTLPASLGRIPNSFRKQSHVLGEFQRWEGANSGRRARRRDWEGAANRKAIPLRLFALPGQRIGAISDGVGVIRIELEHPLEIFDGSVVGATAHVSAA